MPWHPEEQLRRRWPRNYLSRVPKQYRKRLKQNGWNRKRVRKQFKSFWGVPVPPEIKMIRQEGTAKRGSPMIGLGPCNVKIADRRPARMPKYKRGDEKAYMARVAAMGVKTRMVPGRFTGAFNESGDRIMMFTRRGLPRRSRWRKIGYVVETHYLPTKKLEAMGSFKAGKHWIHMHHEGGKWPVAYRDQNGNIRYGKGTYRIKGGWIYH